MKCFCGKKLIVENRDLTFYTCYRHNNKLATNITYISVGSDIDSNIILDETSELSYGIIIESEKHSFITSVKDLVVSRNTFNKLLKFNSLNEIKEYYTTYMVFS